MTELDLQNIIDHLTNAHAELKLASHAAAEGQMIDDASDLDELTDVVSDWIDDLQAEKLQMHETPALKVIDGGA